MYVYIRYMYLLPVYVLYVYTTDCPRDQEPKKWKMTEFSAPTSRPLISATDSLMETWDYCEHSQLSVAEIGCVEVLLPPRDHASCGGIMFLRKPVNTSVLGYGTSFSKMAKTVHNLKLLVPSSRKELFIQYIYIICLFYFLQQLYM